MKKVITQLREFIGTYSVAHWLLVLFFCGATLTINYSFGLKKWLADQSGWADFLCGVVLYGTHFYVGFLVYSLFKNDYRFWKSYQFWGWSIFAISIFSFRESFNAYYEWISAWSAVEFVNANQVTWKYVFRMSLLFVPILSYWYLFQRNEQPLYGFYSKVVDYKLYGMLLLCMVPLIAFASTQTDFLSFYPRAKRLNTETLEWWRYILFECCYAFDFIGIEFFFRGFMVLALTRIVGIHGIIPMACFYLSIHFGKPMGESLSSFFGGTILGVIAYHSRSIYGGIFVHVGIAWLMELGGFIGNYLLSL